MAFSACKYEVWGKVQGVFFRKYTKMKAESLGVVGWVENTPAGTVRGEAQGPRAQLLEMKVWLQKTGSPSSRIDRSAFTEEREIDALTYSGFEVRR